MLLRRAALGAAVSSIAFAASVVFGVVAGVRPALADDDDEAATAPAAAAEPAGEASAAGTDDGASGKRAHKRRGKSRRGKHTARFSGRVVPESELRTEPLPRPSGNLEIVSINNPTDRAKVNIYNKDGSYSIDAVDELNFVLRCRRTDDEKPIDLQLLTWMSLIYDHFG